MSWDILLDGTSIKSKVMSFTITRVWGSFCNEAVVAIADPSLKAQFNFAKVPTSERIEILTDVGSGSVSQGKFFVESPTLYYTPQGISIPSLWGRDASARLTQPFAKRISKEWTSDTSLKGITQELLEVCSLTYDAARVLINDYIIYGGSYLANGMYPADILQELVAKTDGILYTDRNGNLWILKDSYHWGADDLTIGGGIISGINERVEYPDFGNRIKVSTYTKEWEPNAGISLELDDYRIEIGQPTAAKAVVTFRDGTPISSGHGVQWTSDNDAHASFSDQETKTHLERQEAEQQTASSRKSVFTNYPVAQVYSVKIVGSDSDYFAGGTFSGRSIVLGSSLPFTDSVVIVDYDAGGIAINTLVAGAIGEVEVDVHASIEIYIRSTATLSIDSVSGSEQGDKDMNITLIFKDFITDEPIPGVVPIIDGIVKDAADEEGELNLGLMVGGIHTIDDTVKDGYRSVDGDGLENDEFYCGE